MALILLLDSNGQPNRWVNWQTATVYHSKGLVSWSLGNNETVIRGGNNRMTGTQSIITTSSIIAIKGEGKGKRKNRPPSLNNRELFCRDRHLCAYCGKIHPDSKLTRDHVIPKSKGGKDIWTNVVTACGSCNSKKDDRLLEDCGMKLLYIPYMPTRAEHLILSNRNVLADQMEFLMAFLPESSRFKKDQMSSSVTQEARA
jgi:hypothetical protein